MARKKKVAKEKPLDKMTAKELREVGKQMPDVKRKAIRKKKRNW